MKKNILFITEDHSSENFGITTVVSQLADELVIHDPDLHIIIASTGKDAVAQRDRVLVELLPPSRIGNFWRWSPNLVKRIIDIVDQHHVNLIHIHGIWMAAQWSGLSLAKKKNIPCIVSIHGMLEPWFWGKSLSALKKFKKRAYFHYVFYPSITPNTIIHAITPLENNNLLKWFPRQRITVIPNAISMTDEFMTIYDKHIENPEKIILFLGRLHPKKGLDLLIRSFHQASLDKQWRLVIAGPDEVPSYSRNIKGLVSDLQLTSQVEFIGPIFGDEKWTLLRKAWVMAVPSYSEGIGMVNLEAAKYRLPSITSYETGVLDWEDGGGLLIRPNVDDLTRALLEASSWSLSERIERGEKSHQLVNNKYSWDAVFPDWEKLYTDAVNGKY